MINYVPILSWKKGEQDAIRNLSKEVKEHIIPMFEISSGEKVISQFMARLKNCWDNRCYYFYLEENWYDDIESDDEYLQVLREFYNLLDKEYAIPVINLSDISNIDGHEGEFSKGVCIRIQNNEFGMIETTLNDFIKRTNCHNIDILLDLRYVRYDDFYEKSSLLKVALMEMEKASEIRKIIISSCSFPKNFNDIENYTLYSYQRVEKLINETAKKLAEKLSINYVYSDYVLSDLNDIKFVPGMIPSFKIRYTTKDKYLYVRGISLKKGGLDYSEVCRCCSLIAGDPLFSGRDYSWGDSIINDLANSSIEGTGNLTNWVSYTYNHHITLITDIEGSLLS